MIKTVALVCLAFLLTYASPCIAGDNTVGGTAAGEDLSVGTDNTIIGTGAGVAVSSSTDNTLIGYEAGIDVTGSHNVILGEDGGAITSGSSNILIGNSPTGLTAGNNYQLNIGNVIAGTGLGTPSTSTITIPGNLTIEGTCGFGTVNSGTQYELGYYASTGNAISGDSSIVTDSGGDLSLGSGSYQLDADTVLGFPDGDTTSIAVGKSALAAQSATGSGNTALGNLALAAITDGYKNAAVGQGALQYSTNGYGNTAIGLSAMQGTSATPLIGTANTAVGASALGLLEGEAGNNTAIGNAAGSSITTGTDDTLAGYEAGIDVTGSHNVILGQDGGAITSGSSNILIGNSLTGLTVTSNYQLNIGNVITGSGLNTPSTSTVTIQGTLAVDAGLSASTAISSSGQLQCGGNNCNNSTGSTTLNYCPYKGNLKTTAEYGTYTIPSGCLSATLTDMYVGGTAGQSAVANTLYYVYLINVSGATYLDLETTGHATDTTTGVEIEDGNSAKTLVGMIKTNSSKRVFTGGETYYAGDTNTVATWDNRQPTATSCAITALPYPVITSNTPVLISDTDTCSFMSWGDSAQFSSEQTAISDNTDFGGITTWIYLDADSSTVASGLGIEGSEYYYMLVVAPSAYTPTEGYHYAQLYGQAAATVQVTYNGDTPTFVFTIQ
jgi:hypothetical protein